MSEALPPRLARRLSPTAARNYFLLNVLAAPGLGTLLAGDRLLGACQLLVATAGFGLWSLWCGLVIRRAWLLFEKGVEPEPSRLWPYAIAGGALFIGAWIWALITSRRMVRESQESEGR